MNALIDRNRKKPGPNGTVDRRQQVIDAALAVFYEKGYEASSIQDIAERLGILKGSLYYYIKSKEDLLYWVVESQHVQYSALLDHVASLKGSALNKLRILIDEHMKVITTDVERAVVFFRDFQSLTGDRRDTIIAQRDRFEAFILQLIKEGQAEKAILSTIDPKLATKAMLGMLNWTYAWYRPNGEWDAGYLSQSFQRILFDGMIPRT